MGVSPAWLLISAGLCTTLLFFLHLGDIVPLGSFTKATTGIASGYRDPGYDQLHLNFNQTKVGQGLILFSPLYQGTVCMGNPKGEGAGGCTPTPSINEIAGLVDLKQHKTRRKSSCHVWD